MQCMQYESHTEVRIGISGWTPLMRPSTKLTGISHEEPTVLWIASTNPQDVVKAVLDAAEANNLDVCYTGNGRVELSTSFDIKFDRSRQNDMGASTIIALAIENVNRKPGHIDTRVRPSRYPAGYVRH